jgi:predicted short-subunit dehydrogenase-like oxidoreductase (DUF2520 family)
MSLNFCLIGAGNLATQLSKAFKSKGFTITQVYSRTEKSAKYLANSLTADYTISAHEIDKNADIYFVALKDQIVDEVLSKIDFENKLVVHCSGSLSLSSLERYSENIGVFYPLQTFSKSRDIDFGEIPICIESNSNKNEKLLLQIAGELSDSVFVMNSEERKLLHVSAVFACNFVNHFYTIAADILKSKNIPFEVLKPLILETAKKIQELEPEKAQTGPAVRFDENTMNSHLNKLKEFGEYQQLYKLISKSIFDRYNK